HDPRELVLLRPVHHPDLERRLRRHTPALPSPPRRRRALHDPHARTVPHRVGRRRVRRTAAGRRAGHERGEHRSPAASRCTHPSRHAALARLLAHRRLRPWSAPSTIAIVEDCARGGKSGAKGERQGGNLKLKLKLNLKAFRMSKTERPSISTSTSISSSPPLSPRSRRASRCAHARRTAPRARPP